MSEQEKISTSAEMRTDTLDRVLRYAFQKGGVKSSQIEPVESHWRTVVARLREMQAMPRADNPESVPALIYANFKPKATRTDANVISMTALVLDIDEDADLDRLRAALTGWAAVIYTTKRSTQTSPRLRVILPLATPVAAHDWRSAYQQFVLSLGLPGVDSCAEKLSQPFLAPPGGGHFEYLSGDWLDPTPFITAARQAEFDALPEPEPIAQNLQPVPAFDLNWLPRSLRAWVADSAYRMQCPVDFCAVGAVITLASVVGAGIGIKPKRKDDWLVVPNCWGGLISPPSKKKSPSLAEMLKPLARLEAKQRANSSQAQRDANDPEIKTRIKVLKKELETTIKSEIEAEQLRKAESAYMAASACSTTENRRSNAENIKAGQIKSTTFRSIEEIKRDLAALTEPAAQNIQERFRTNDATLEALHDLLADNPRGILVFRDELIGLLKGWERQGHEQDRQFFLEAWNGHGSFPLDRIGRGHVYCENMCVSILGGTQPDKIRNYLYQARDENDGLLQRFQLLVYPDVQPFNGIVDEYPNAIARDTAFAKFEILASTDFAALVPMNSHDKIPSVRFDDEAQAFFFDWYERLHRGPLENPDESPMMVEMLSKQPKTMVSLALLFHLVECADSIAAGLPILPVSFRAATRAANWCTYLEAHARRIYAVVGSLQSQAAAALAERISKGQLDVFDDTGFTAREIYRRKWSMLDDRDIVELALAELVEAGWLLSENKPAGWQMRGHIRFRVNPKVRRKQ